jgi:hypothetical protein
MLLVIKFNKKWMYMAINVDYSAIPGCVPKSPSVEENYDSLTAKIQNLALDVLEGRALFDEAMKGLPKQQRHLLFVDRVRWKTTEPMPNANPREFDNNEPGYHDAMMRAFKHIKNTVGERINADKLCELHDVCVDGVFHDSTRTKPFRKGYFPGFAYGLIWKRASAKAQKELVSEKLLLHGNSPTFSGDYDNFEYLSTYMPVGGKAWRVFSRFTKDAELGTVYQKVNELFDKYYTAIESARSDDDKLAAIVNVCRALQVFHVFPDGNGRTIQVALLTKLLIENRFPLTILSDFANFGTGINSTDEMVALLKEGMDNYQRVVEQLNNQ